MGELESAMRISKFEVYPLSIGYKRNEVSSIINRGGVSDVIIKITADNGLVGWGECCTPGDTASVEDAARSAGPFLLGRDPWNKEAISREFYIHGNWQFQAMTGNFAFAGIDMALWDLCGKECGQPLYRFFGGAIRNEVDYFYYLEWADEQGMVAQCRDGLNRRYSVFYMKIGVDERREEAMVAAVRQTIGTGGKIRLDVNQSWSLPQAARVLGQWHERYKLDFVEAPVPVDPVENMLDLKRRVTVPLCVNEGLWREADAMRVINSRCADYLCISQYWVGSLRRLHTIIHAANLSGQLICKHTHGEYGIAAACGQHMMLAAPNACDGHQQTAQVMKDDILKERIPITDGPTWGLITGPGLGVEVDEEKVKTYHEAYLREGEYVTFGDGFRPRC